MSEDFKDNVTSPAQWVRILYMLFFAVVCWLLGIIITVLVIAQALLSLVFGKDNANLRKLGILLSRYFYQILLYLSYASQMRPFPFSNFPTVDAVPDDDIADYDTGEEAASYAASEGDDVFADISFTDDASDDDQTDMDSDKRSE